IVQEYRVRKAPHIFVKEENLLKYIAYVLGITITGLTVWTLATQSNEVQNEAWPQCAAQPWSLTWYAFEVLLLMIGLRLCVKGRHCGGTEKWRFLAVFCIEVFITLFINLLRYVIRHTARSDVQMILVFLHLHLTTTPNLIIIFAPKFVAVS
ncbi:unnamed protein product, partial [Enterobius vermicularis]|uniref:G_PROTEIN_RECEP_F3_4 domain-containing protein n=1 Tax=Enterobius vermicularis TaxID=51028 RepID=A0A0N4UTZ8_ENTVE